MFGAFFQISGGIWDVSAHLEGIPETFFTPQHMVLYAGVALSLLASSTGAAMRATTFRRAAASEQSALTGLLLSLAGGSLQLVAGPLDLEWHRQFGFDPFLFTPSHSLLIVGIILNGVGMAMGTSRLRQVVGSGSDFGRFSRPRFLVLLSIVSLSTLWLVLNGLVYLITDVDGIAYTFRLSAAWVRQASPVAFAASGILLAGTGTLVLLSARRILPWKGSLTMVVGLGALVTLLANLTFRTVYLFESGSQNSASAIASFIPLYVLFLAPVIVFDLLAKIDPGRNKVLLAGVLLGPFVSFLDGFYSLVLWTGGNVPVTDVFSTGRIYLIIALAVPMATAGAIAGFSRSRFSAVLLSARHWPK